MWKDKNLENFRIKEKERGKWGGKEEKSNISVIKTYNKIHLLPK